MRLSSNNFTQSVERVEQVVNTLASLSNIMIVMQCELESLDLSSSSNSNIESTKKIIESIKTIRKLIDNNYSDFIEDIHIAKDGVKKTYCHYCTGAGVCIVCCSDNDSSVFISEIEGNA